VRRRRRRIRQQRQVELSFFWWGGEKRAFPCAGSVPGPNPSPRLSEVSGRLRVPRSTMDIHGLARFDLLAVGA
jgi:hypothetical protein